jgi:hypothetical protein
VYDHTHIASYRHLRVGNIGGEYGYWLLGETNATLLVVFQVTLFCSSLRRNTPKQFSLEFSGRVARTDGQLLLVDSGEDDSDEDLTQDSSPVSGDGNAKF